MIPYILKSSISLIILFGLYWILLRQVKLFRFTRFFLLFAILLSLALPFISISVNLFNSEVQKSYTSIVNSIVPLFNSEKNIDHFNLDQSPTEVISSKINISQILILIYVLGIIIFLFRFLKNIFIISQQIKSSEKVSLSGWRLALIDTQINPYCFFNTVFVNKHDYQTNKIERELLSHELEHVRQFHSFDIIFIEIIQIIYWFNPILLLYNRAIRINHEFLADNNAIRDFSDIKSYSEILINFIGSKSNIPLTSGFYQSITKKRLLMLIKSNPSRVSVSFRFLIISILVVGFTLLMSFKQQHIQNVDEKVIKYSSSGYINSDQINKRITLIQGAVLKYGDLEIRADSIVIDMNTDQVFASGRVNAGSITSKPLIKEGNQSFEAEEITYNFNTHLVLTKNIIAKEIVNDTVLFSSLVLHIEIGNKKNNLLVQLIDDMENIVKTQTVDATGKSSFSQIKEGKYNLRAIFDLNNNGKYEPHMDSVSYFPRKLEIKAGWDIVQDWDLSSLE